MVKTSQSWCVPFFLNVDQKVKVPSVLHSAFLIKVITELDLQNRINYIMDRAGMTFHVKILHYIVLKLL
jgi:hypothetical protein